MTEWTRRAPAATFDLHGMSVLEAVRSAEQFLLAQGGARRGAVVQIITGRGSHGGGAPVRSRVGSLLRRMREEKRSVREFVLEDNEGSYLVQLFS